VRDIAVSSHIAPVVDRKRDERAKIAKAFTIAPHEPGKLLAFLVSGVAAVPASDDLTPLVDVTGQSVRSDLLEAVTRGPQKPNKPAGPFYGRAHNIASVIDRTRARIIEVA